MFCFRLYTQLFFPPLRAQATSHRAGDNSTKPRVLRMYTRRALKAAVDAIPPKRTVTSAAHDSCRKIRSVRTFQRCACIKKRKKKNVTATEIVLALRPGRLRAVDNLPVASVLVILERRRQRVMQICGSILGLRSVQDPPHKVCGHSPAIRPLEDSDVVRERDRKIYRTRFRKGKKK